MPTLKKIERVISHEVNSVQSPPFPVALPPGAVVNLSELTVPLSRSRNAFIATAVINWSVTFTPLVPPQTINSPGFAQITFELLRDGDPIHQITQSANQPIFSNQSPFSTASTAIKRVSMQHLDITSFGSMRSQQATFLIRAKNIILTPPVQIIGTVIIPSATVTAAAGLTSLLVEEIKTTRAQDLET